jgi:glyoxylase-like metal-dependent hydrolase (beta-lactamase superfamily II)
LIFNHRALATPHADLEKWILSLKNLQKFDFDVCVPGHGVAFKDKKPFAQNIKYLTFLKNRLAYGRKNGLDIFEILALDVPKDIKSFSIFKEEYERSIINLYNRYEKELKK